MFPYVGLVADALLLEDASCSGSFPEPCPTSEYSDPRQGYPYAVKQTKEVEDNSQLKDDRKDPKLIANLVKDGNYGMPYLPEGVYADLRRQIILYVAGSCIRDSNNPFLITLHWQTYGRALRLYACKNALHILRKITEERCCDDCI